MGKITDIMDIHLGVTIKEELISDFSPKANLLYPYYGITKIRNRGPKMCYTCGMMKVINKQKYCFKYEGRCVRVNGKCTYSLIINT